MEEFYEEDIFYHEEKEEEKGEDSTEPDSDFAIIPSQDGKSMPIPIPLKENASRSWTAGFNYNGTGSNTQDDDDDGEDEGDDYDANTGKGIVPPHILLQQRNSGKMAFSVCIGNGRTLKGRDLTATRDSILLQTSFIEK